MAGGWKQIDVILTAAQVSAPIDSIEISFKDADHQLIGAVVVIAIARGAVQQHCRSRLNPAKSAARILSKADMLSVLSSNTCFLMADNSSVIIPIPTPWM